jgi:hypothetical protein
MRCEAKMLSRLGWSLICRLPFSNMHMQLFFLLDEGFKMIGT